MRSSNPSTIRIPANTELPKSVGSRLQQVGGETILEYWIPAEDLEELNDNIVGEIEQVARFE